MSTIDVQAMYERLSYQEKETISSIQKILGYIKTCPEVYNDPVQLIEDLEYSLQGLWKFSRNSNYHSHWIGIKGCTCPKMDNRDPLYFGRGKIFNFTCKWHGKGAEV